jgi:hypothetical protein
MQPANGCCAGCRRPQRAAEEGYGRTLPGACIGVSRKSKRCWPQALVRHGVLSLRFCFSTGQGAETTAQHPGDRGLGALQCHHVHDETEWTPVQVDGVTVYPSAEEVFCQSSSVDRHCGVMVGGQNGLCSHGDP